MNAALDTVSQIARYSLVVVLMVPLLGGALIMAPFSRDLGWRMVRAWNRMTLSIFEISYEVRYAAGPDQLDQGGVIVGLTQRSLLDPTVGYAGWNRPVKAIWNIEYALIPFFGWVTFILGWVIVRQYPAQARRQIEKAAQYAADGGLVYLSAEGKRSLDGRLNPYKKGPVVMALKAQCLIHPVYMVGSRRCMPPGDWRIRPGKIIVTHMAPISTAGMSYEDRNELLATLRAAGEKEHVRGSSAAG